MKDTDPPLTPELLLQAYQIGVFPMSESRDTPEIFWVDPRQRGILPLDGFHISRRLARTLRRDRFQISYDRDFQGVMLGCADRDETWINATILDLYTQLFHAGHAHSIEVWDDRRLVGGVYGVTLGAVFFGESMFSKATGASKVALAHLVDRLRLSGFTLFDTQFLTTHLASLGGVEIPRQAFHDLLQQGLARPARFDAQSPAARGQDVVQRNAQTS